jgi:pSer/pThr/pTyr-binding forkhead associated (FHA) protein
MLRVTLVLEKKKRILRRVDLRRPRTVVGRMLGCDVRLPSAEVSRRHCLLLIGDNDLHIEDMNSVNGTYLNDIAVIGRQQVNPGDRLQIGPYLFVIEFGPLPLDFDPLPLQPKKKAAAHDLPSAQKSKEPSPAPDKTGELFTGEYVSRSDRADGAEILEEVFDDAEVIEVAPEELEVISEEPEELVDDVEVVLDDDAPLTLPADADSRGILTRLTDPDLPSESAKS